MAVPSAGAVIIADEVLTGKVPDSNSHVLAQFLFQRGIRLSSILTVPDSIDAIAEAVAACSRRFTHVFTSGGIGCTCDDMTYAGVAKAFGRQMALHTPTVDRMDGHLRAKHMPLSEARLKMAMFPDPAEIVPLEGLWAPLVIVDNVLILPGVPSLFERMLYMSADRFRGVRIFRRLVFTMKYEAELAEHLETASHMFSPRDQANPLSLSIGSYPQFDARAAYRVMLSVESPSESLCNEVARFLQQKVDGFDLPPDVLAQQPGIDVARDVGATVATATTTCLR